MLIPLAMLPPCRRAVVKNILGGRGLIRRLTELGFTPDAEVHVFKSSPGPVLVSVRGSRVAIGWGVAMKILVEVVE